MWLCFRWSLLEKYSCKASKLHLKPRRFKIFIEALVSLLFIYSINGTNMFWFCWTDWNILPMKEHQLLKDRKKSVRKRPTHGEYSPPAPSTVTNQSRASGHDNRTVKLVLVDSQNIQKVGSGKGPLKRNVNLSINRSNNKGDSTTMKPARQQRRKPGIFLLLLLLFPHLGYIFYLEKRFGRRCFAFSFSFCGV